jgi:peroxiredoxin
VAVGVFLLKSLREQRWFRWAMDLAILGVVVIAISAWQSRGHLRGAPPTFSLRSVEGDLVENATLTGKPTMLVFWAPWCSVCTVESRNVSWIQDLVGTHANVVSIASDYDSLDDVRGYMTKHGVDYPVLLGGTKTARAFGVKAFPSVFFLDDDGNVTSSVVGYTTTPGLLWRLML